MPNIDVINLSKGAFTLLFFFFFFANLFFDTSLLILQFTISHFLKKYIYVLFYFYFYFFCFIIRVPKNKFKNRTSKDVFNKEEANNVKWRVSMGGVKKTLKKKIIGGCSKFIKYNRKHRRVSYKRKRKCLVKTWLGDFFSLQRFFLSDVLVFSLLSRFELLFFYMKFLFNWDFCFFLFIYLFLETMLLSKILISRSFLKPDRFWFQKKWWKKYTLTTAENGKKSAQIDKTIITLTFYMKPDFPRIKKWSGNCNVNLTRFSYN